VKSEKYRRKVVATIDLSGSRCNLSLGELFDGIPKLKSIFSMQWVSYELV
jgi:hypothetical protein